MALGLMCGICGHDKHATPSKRGTVSNMGGNCLMAELLNFPSNGYVSIPLMSLRMYVWHYYLLGDTVDHQFESLNVNLTDQTILTNDSKKSLRELNSSGVESINFAQFTNETRKGITTQNLTELANTLDVFADNMTSIKSGLPGGNQTKAQSIIDRARATAAALRILDKDTVQAMASKANELDQNVVELKKIGGNLNDDATKTLKAAEEAETALHGSANKVKTVITNYKDRVLGYGFQFTAHILHLVTHELGRCKPLTNIFDAVVVLACEDFLMPFNGFWLAIGFCLFFFIPAIIFSVKLAKHYRRMKYESDFDDYDGHDMMEMGQPVGQEKKLWANPK
ncbi:Prominin-1-A [Exaiptasia diaphana]|nr:Prominin-1-A [Exaiptasia diaphana]